MASKHYDINIRGDVQGVGFRHYIRLKAHELGITGFICNQADGSVYMEAEGSGGALNKLKTWCWRGPSAAAVENVTVHEDGLLKNYQDFTVALKPVRLRYGLSRKADGSMKLHSAARETNLVRFFSPFSIRHEQIVSAGLAHGRGVVAVDASGGGGIIKDTDGLVTVARGLVLTVTTADCLPLYIWNTYQTVAGIAHAGWRGVRDNIAAEMVATCKREYGIDASGMKALIGPHIGPCHFEVKNDVAGQFAAAQVVKRNGRYYIDLAASAREQLANAGVSDVTVSTDCTYCLPENFFSCRRDKPKEIQAMLAYIILTV